MTLKGWRVVKPQHNQSICNMIYTCSTSPNNPETINTNYYIFCQMLIVQITLIIGIIL